MSNDRRDESVLGVAFFKRYGQDHAEVGCLAIHSDYRKVFVHFELLFDIFDFGGMRRS